MENQHRQISGYRELSQAEVDLMNEIKAAGPVLEALISKVQRHVNLQAMGADGGSAEDVRLRGAEPGRWAAIARTDFQTGLMALTRAVAQPTFF